MSSLARKRMVATALAGATIAGALAAPTVSADSESVPPPPSSIAASAGKAYDELRSPTDSQSVPPPASSMAASAGKAYEELRAPDRLPTEPTVAPAPVVDEPSGFDLPSAAIGAATGAGLVILLLAAAGLIRRRPLARIARS